MPFRPGLVTAGQQSTVPESGAAWQLRNYIGDLDGMLVKRPGLTQWGQTLKEPTPGTVASPRITAFAEFFTNPPSGFIITDSSSGLVSTTGGLGEWRVTVREGTGGESYTAGWSVPALSSGKEWSLRFMFRGTNMPVYTAPSTDDNTFIIRAQGDSASDKEFAIFAGGLYYRKDADNQYELVTGSEDVGAGIWVNVEIRCDDDTGNTTVYLNDVLIDTISSALIKPMPLSGTYAFEFRWEVEGTAGSADGTQYTTKLSSVMYNDTITSPFTAQPIVGLIDYQYNSKAGSVLRSALTAAGSYVYHDNGLQQAWRPLHTKAESNIYFAKYRDSIVWSDHNNGAIAKLWKWDGFVAPEALDGPPCRFLVEHKQRLCAWGDILNPRRWYYSGDRQPNVFFSPGPDNVEDQFSVALDAGYQELPSEAKEVVASIGDYYGTAILAGDTGFWKLGGDGVFSFTLQGLKTRTGAASARSLAQVGNDIWSGSRQGISSLASTEKFGDILAAFPSAPIQDLWLPDINSDFTINQTFINRMKLAYSATTSYVYVAVPLTQDHETKRMYAHNLSTEKWYGPWDIPIDSDVHAMAVMELASPVTEVVMVGDSLGRTGYLNIFAKSDYGTAYTGTIESVTHTGRSVDPVLTGMDKAWHVLRLFYLPRGDFEYDFTHWIDADLVETTSTFKQNNTDPKAYVLADTDGTEGDIRLDLPAALLRSGQEMTIEEIDINESGRDWTFRIDQAGAGQDLQLQGYEIEVTPSGYASPGGAA
jgi:hypothetical protein